MSFEGRTYLITTDCHSSFFEIDQLTDMSAETVIRKVKKIFGRRTRSTIPMTSDRLNTTDCMKTKVQKEDHVASKVSSVNKNLHDLSILKPGQTVRLQPIANNSKEWTEGTITQQLKSRTYEVESDGKKYRRNRSFVRPSKKSLHDVNTRETYIFTKT